MLINEIIILVVFLLSIATVYFLELWFVITFALNKLRKRKQPKILRTKSSVLVHILAVIGVICFLYGYFIEPYWIEVKMVPIQTDKLKHTSFRVVQISDFHCEKNVRKEKRTVELINKLEPDVIVFTGDAVNTPSALPVFKDAMKNLNASIGKFAVYGNWEIWHWPGLDYYSQTDFQLLNADTIMLDKNDETLFVSGLSCDNPRAAGKVLQDLSADRFNIFLYHYPGLVEDVEDFHIDLYLCGHTHGGQVALPFYGALITLSKFGKKYESGLYIVNGTKLYVNRGIGLDAWPAPQVRFLARPEITVFDIGPKSGLTADNEAE